MKNTLLIFVLMISGLVHSSSAADSMDDVKNHNDQQACVAKSVKLQGFDAGLLLNVMLNFFCQDNAYDPKSSYSDFKGNVLGQIPAKKYHDIWDEQFNDYFFRIVLIGCCQHSPSVKSLVLDRLKVRINQVKELQNPEKLLQVLTTLETLVLNAPPRD